MSHKLGASVLRPYKRFKRFVPWNQLFFSAMGKRSIDQAESEADEDLRSMSKSSGEQHSLSYSEIAWREE